MNNKFIILRRKIGSQAKLAQLLNKSRYCISKWENGVSKPKADDFDKIAQVLGCSLTEVVQMFCIKSERDKL